MPGPIYLSFIVTFQHSYGVNDDIQVFNQMTYLGGGGGGLVWGVRGQ